MATFTTNQFRHLYVAKALKNTSVVASDDIGTIAVKADTAKNHLYFEYVSPGGIIRSDLIDINNVLYASTKDADSLARPLKKMKVALDSGINSGNPVAGQDYILRIVFKNYIGLSEEDQYFKYGMVHAVTGMSAETFYNVLLDSLVKNFSRETNKMLKFYLDGVKATVAMTTNTGITVTAKTLGTAGNSLKFAVASVAAAEAGVTVTTASGVTTISASLTGTAKTIADLKALISGNTAANALITITGTDATAVVAETTAVALAGGSTTGVIVEELEQYWSLGTFEQLPVNFKLFPATITVSGDELIWGVVTNEASTAKVENGKIAADMEYFYTGERGDIYRNVGFPNVIKTTYLVDPSTKYNMIDIQYFYAGGAENPQRSERTLTLLIPKVGSTNSVSNDLANDIITAINTASGLSLTALDDSAI